jgi:hypothetical protein
LKLASDSGDIIRAAFLKSGVKGLTAAASSFSGEWFVWESVWVFTAASPFGVFNTVDQWATDFFVEVWLHVLFVDLTTGNEQVEYFQDENTFDFAGTVGAESGVVDWVNVVESVAVKDQVRLTSSSTWKVLDFPWNARVVSGEFFKVEHAAIVTISKFFTEVINSVNWFSVTSSVVVFEVAPATVLVDSVKVIAGEDIRNGSWLRSVSLDQ